jgi:hypothetical protein
MPENYTVDNLMTTHEHGWYTLTFWKYQRHINPSIL